MNIRLAFRNIFRNRWRSALTMGGIAMAVGLLVWMTCMVDAWMQLMVRAAIGVQIGDVQIHTTAYVDEPSLFHALDLDDGTLDAARATPGVAAASPRVLAFGLVGQEKRSAVGQLIGVDPGAEAAVTSVDRTVTAGSWLSASPPAPPAPREAVLGQSLARLLDVQPGAELVLFLQAADGSLGNDVLKVVGVVSTANTALDRLAIYAHLDDVQYVTALDGKAHEIALRTDAAHPLEEVAAALRTRLAQVRPADAPALAVRPWSELLPEFHAMVGFMDAYMWVIYFVIYLIAALGILNTQRMSVLDRQREFGVLLAIGLTPGRLARLIVLETVLLTVLGALLGAALGTGVALHHSINGFDMGMFSDTGTGGSFTWMGVAFDSVVYFRVTAKALLDPLAAIGVVALLCGLWPAWKAATLDAVRAISGRT